MPHHEIIAKTQGRITAAFVQGPAARWAFVVLAALFALPSMAQSLMDVCHAEDPADPDYDITDFNPRRDADDWCKLAYHSPHKARRQLSKAVALVRSENNPNRFYFDPRVDPQDPHPVQLLRPWMAADGYAVRWLKTPTYGTEGELVSFAFVPNADPDDEDYWQPNFTLRIDDEGRFPELEFPLVRFYSARFSGDGYEAFLYRDVFDTTDDRYLFVGGTTHQALEQANMHGAALMDASQLKRGIEGALENCMRDPIDLGCVFFVEAPRRAGSDEAAMHDSPLIADPGSPLLE